MEVLPVFIFLSLIPMNHEIVHWLFTVGAHVQVSEYEVNYSASLAFL